MFTKKHYEQIAALLNAERRKISDDQTLDKGVRAAKVAELNDVVIAFVRIFDADARGKFRELQFIGACDRDPPEA